MFQLPCGVKAYVLSSVYSSLLFRPRFCGFFLLMLLQFDHFGLVYSTLAAERWDCRGLVVVLKCCSFMLYAPRVLLHAVTVHRDSTPGGVVIPGVDHTFALSSYYPCYFLDPLEAHTCTAERNSKR